MTQLIRTLIAKFKNVSLYHFFIVIVCLIFCLACCRHFPSLMIDVGHELYIPWQIATTDKLLIKDFFIVFFPLEYQLNALLFLIFGKKLAIFSFLGILFSCLFINAIFLLFKKILGEKLAFFVSVLGIIVSIYPFNVLNTLISYNWGFVYGLVSALYSILCFINYIELKNDKFLLYSSILAGFAFAFKYEYFILAFLFFIFLIYKRKWLYSILIFLPLILSYSILFIKGLSFSDFFVYLDNLKNYMNSESLLQFYKSSNSFIFGISNLCSNCVFSALIFSFYILILFFALKIKNNNFIKYFLIVFVYFLFYRCSLNILFFKYSLAFVPIVAIIFGVLSFKKLNLTEKIIYFAILSICFKSFVFCYGTYSNYYFPLYLGLFLFFLIKKFNFKIGKYILIFFLLFGISLLKLEYSSFISKDTDIELNGGKIKYFSNFAHNTNLLIDYLNKNTKIEDKVLVVPTGTLINFAANRSSYDRYILLSSEFIDAFGEKSVIQDLSKNPPEFIVFSNYVSEGYKYNYFCSDYAKELCKYIFQNYNEVYKQDFIDYKNGIVFSVYKSKNY